MPTMTLAQAKAGAAAANIDTALPGWLQKFIDLLRLILSLVPATPAGPMTAKAGCDPTHYACCLKVTNGAAQHLVDCLEMLQCCSDGC